jgi:hypothetical protein
VTVPDGADPFTEALVGADRGWVSVTAGADRRAFVINLANDRHHWAVGTTDDLVTVALVADRWRAGATLRQLHERFPFMTYTRLAQGYEDGDPIGAQWAHLLDDPDLTLIRPLLLAARADERLGRLFPTVSHHTLARFALDHTARDSEDVVIAMRGQGGFEVWATWLPTRSAAATIAEAVDAAARLRL